MNVRGFLLQNPHPHLIRITNQDGEVSEMMPGRKPKARVAESIVALNPELIECFDAEGHLLRAVRPAEIAVRPALPPEVPEELKGDPHAGMVCLFANLLHRAYSHSTEVAFSKLVELVERMDQRTDSIEARLERAEANHRRSQQERIDDLFDRAAEEATEAQHGGGQRMLEAFIASAAQAQAQAEKQKPNGGRS
jgi:hypothetical protein